MEGAGVRGDSRGPRWGLESLGRKGSPGLVLPSGSPALNSLRGIRAAFLRGDWDQAPKAVWAKMGGPGEGSREHGWQSAPWHTPTGPPLPGMGAGHAHCSDRPGDSPEGGIPGEGTPRTPHGPLGDPGHGWRERGVLMGPWPCWRVTSRARHGDAPGLRRPCLYTTQLNLSSSFWLVGPQLCLECSCMEVNEAARQRLAGLPGNL